MLIIGAKGFAKEILEIIHLTNQDTNLCFYDDVSTNLPPKLFNQFSILRTEQEVLEYFEKGDVRFALGIGNPILRRKMNDKFSSLGGELTSLISPRANIGSYGVSIGDGCNVMDGAILSNDVKVGKGVIVYYNSIVTHDCRIGDFVEISPNVQILGRVKISNYCQIGSNATILPDLRIGENVIIGAGAVVTKDIPENTMVMGVPAKIVKELKPLNL